jgi:hypothetical protein
MAASDDGRTRRLVRALGSAAALGLLLSSACGGKSSSDTEQPGVVCRHGGASYRPGEGFPDEDGCNTCSCGPDGSITCTARACAPTCSVGGATYRLGQTFPAPDGCNTCTCTLDGVSCTEIGCGTGCYYAGKHFAIGEYFPDEDGCNTCTCEQGGQVSCTNVGCPTPECTYLGATYFAGQSFPSRDGCNTCTCYPDSTIGCTEIFCPCKPEVEWWRNYVAKSVSVCALIDYGCPSNTTLFSNECGCGCEQAQHCPRFLLCATPEDCALCPFSTRVIPD